MILGYVCKYTPVELLTSLGAKTERISPSVSSFNRADAMMHPNMCSYAKSVLEWMPLHEKDCEGIVFTTCCDSIRRLYDTVKTAYPGKFFYLLDIPRKTDDSATALYAERILALAESYRKFRKTAGEDTALSDAADRDTGAACIPAGIPEEKASFISRNYEIKASFLDEFLHGKKISLYQEKQKEKEANYHPSSSRQTSNIQRFVMIVGKSAAEVRKKAEELLHQFEQCGYSVLDSSSLYPAIQADKDCAIVADPYQIAAKRIAQTDGKPARYITYVSIDNIQSEREKQDLPTSEDLTFVTACARIRQAMLNGDSVIFSVSNPDSEILRNILRILPSSHPVSKELVALVRVPQSIEERSSDSEIIVEGEEDMRYSFSDLSAGWDLMKTMEENP